LKASGSSRRFFGLYPPLTIVILISIWQRGTTRRRGLLHPVMAFFLAIGLLGAARIGDAPRIFSPSSPRQGFCSATACSVLWC
jgi:K+ transporter